jgi:hypothetical protein
MRSVRRASGLVQTLKTGESAAKPYRARLTALTKILVAGLRHSVTVTPPKQRHCQIDWETVSAPS